MSVWEDAALVCAVVLGMVVIAALASLMAACYAWAFHPVVGWIVGGMLVTNTALRIDVMDDV